MKEQLHVLMFGRITSYKISYAEIFYIRTTQNQATVCLASNMIVYFVENFFAKKETY